jgi:hypothetical protein
MPRRSRNIIRWNSKNGHIYTTSANHHASVIIHGSSSNHSHSNIIRIVTKHAAAAAEQRQQPKIASTSFAPSLRVRQPQQQQR